MRCLLKFELPVEAANVAIKDGRFEKNFPSILDELKPESAYFLAQDGKRTGLIFIDLKDPSQIPAVVEPWLLAFNASVELIPAMNLEDLMKAIPAIKHAAKKYGG